MSNVYSIYIHLAKAGAFYFIFIKKMEKIYKRSLFNIQERSWWTDLILPVLFSVFFLMKGLFREGECFGSPLATTAFNFNRGEKAESWFILTGNLFLHFINLYSLFLVIFKPQDFNRTLIEKKHLYWSSQTEQGAEIMT